VTRAEFERTIEQWGEHDTYGLRLFLDNGTTVLAREWGFDDKEDTLLRVIARGRQAMIAVSRIVVVERIPSSQ
jgi:hypothetical protein